MLVTLVSASLELLAVYGADGVRHFGAVYQQSARLYEEEDEGDYRAEYEGQPRQPVHGYCAHG